KGESLLHLRPMDSLQSRAIPGTDGAGTPFWSPDNKSVAFVAGGKLRRLEGAGGSPSVLWDTSLPRGGTWSEDGVIVFAERNTGLMRIPAGGGTPSAVTTVDRKARDRFHYYPQFLPGGKRYLYLVRAAGDSAGIYLGWLEK